MFAPPMKKDFSKGMKFWSGPVLRQARNVLKAIAAGVPRAGIGESPRSLGKGNKGTPLMDVIPNCAKGVLRFRVLWL